MCDYFRGMDGFELENCRATYYQSHSNTLEIARGASKHGELLTGA